MAIPPRYVRRQVTRHGAYESFASSDGQTLYYTKDRGVYGIWSVPVSGGDEKPVPELSRAGYWRSWGIARDGLYFVTNGHSTGFVLKLFDFARRNVADLMTMEKEPLWLGAGLGVSTDGKSVLYAQSDHVINDIMLVEGFR